MKREICNARFWTGCGKDFLTSQLFGTDTIAESIFEAFKYLDKKVQQHPGIAESDFKLTITAFDKNKS